MFRKTLAVTLSLAVLGVLLVVLLAVVGAISDAHAQSLWPSTKVRMDSGNTLQEDVDQGNIGGDPGAASFAEFKTCVETWDPVTDPVRECVMAANVVETTATDYILTVPDGGAPDGTSLSLDFNNASLTSTGSGITNIVTLVMDNFAHDHDLYFANLVISGSVDDPTETGLVFRQNAPTVPDRENGGNVGRTYMWNVHIGQNGLRETGDNAFRWEGDTIDRHINVYSSHFEAGGTIFELAPNTTQISGGCAVAITDCQPMTAFNMRDVILTGLNANPANQGLCFDSSARDPVGSSQEQPLISYGLDYERFDHVKAFACDGFLSHAYNLYSRDLMLSNIGSSTTNRSPVQHEGVHTDVRYRVQSHAAGTSTTNHFPLTIGADSQSVYFEATDHDCELVNKILVTGIVESVAGATAPPGYIEVDYRPGAATNQACARRSAYGPILEGLIAGSTDVAAERRVLGRRQVRAYAFTTSATIPEHLCRQDIDITNAGAPGAITLTLPATVEAETQCSFVQVASQALTIAAGSGDFISLVSGAGGFGSTISTTASPSGSQIRLSGSGASIIWLERDSLGTWGVP